jgi:hypothetical protein
MSAFSNYSEEKIVEHFLRNNAVASPVTVYMALFESDPGEDNSGTETAYANYARQVATWTSLDASGQTQNSNVITFAANGNASAAIALTHAALYDAATNGNLILKGALSTPKTLQVGDVLSFSINAISLTIN